MKGATLYIDQHGNKFYASSLQELKSEMAVSARCKAEYMYLDKLIDGKCQTHHIGYVIKGHWLTAYGNIEIPL